LKCGLTPDIASAGRESGMTPDDDSKRHEDCCAPPAAPARSSAGAGWLHVPAMDCAAEEFQIRRALEPLPGVRSLTFRLAERRLRVEADTVVVDEATAILGRIGFVATRVGAQATAAADTEHVHRPGPDLSSRAQRGISSLWPAGVWQLGLALALALGAEVLELVAPDTRAWQALGFALAAAAIAFSGLDVYRKGLAALFRGQLNINALMSVAVTGAVLIGEWSEAAMVMALYAIAELIEARAVERARDAVGKLLALAPATATIRQADGSWQVRPVGEAALDAVVRIAPGERVPLDGTVVAGTSSIDQAPITGESIPVDKAPGDPVFAGTINAHGMLEVRITALEGNSTLARIIHAVEQAQGRRAPTQRFVDRFAAIYTPAVFAFAVLVALSGPLLFDWSWMESIYKALVLLVIACPCALVISTPVTIVSALTAAARRGILIKGGVYLESARKLRAVALDKTGTITEGKPKLIDWRAVGKADRERVAALAGALAGHSDHPVSRALAQGLPCSTLALADFKALAGRGVSATVDGREFVLGNHRLMEERGQCDGALEAQLNEHESAGRTVTMLASPDGVLGIFAVADTIKPGSAQAVRELKALGVHPVMLTGDNATTARSIAAQAGIDDARGDLLPTDKLEILEQLQRQHGATAMIGDGINDAPALAQSDLGFAMGAAGTDTAMESADVVIMNDDLRRVPETIRLSRRTRAVLWQNIGLALGIKAVFFVLAVFGSATMWMAVFADMGASLLVVGNGLRLLRRSG
jgi:Cd2+/Zn2+-exporting ATPase